MNRNCELSEGDKVRLCSQGSIGEILKISGNRARVAFAAIKVSIPLSQLTKLTLTSKDIRPAKVVVRPTSVINLSTDAFSSFNTTIDLHGMYVQEAVAALENFIDKALLLGHTHLKVIHGKGKGVLRSAIRAYLQSANHIKQVIDKHPYPGAEGVTLVVL